MHMNSHNISEQARCAAEWLWSRTGAIAAQSMEQTRVTRHLETLSPRLLADIGLDRDDVASAVAGRMSRPDPYLSADFTIQSMVSDLRNMRRRREVRRMKRNFDMQRQVSGLALAHAA